MQAIKITNNIYWVGAIDWNLRNFHGYMTQKGSTYNAYLILDDKITLIDTVKNKLYEEMLERIKDVIDPTKIDYIISNHVEMDHSGSLPKLKTICPEAQIVTSPNGEKGLKKHYKEDWNFKIVKSGEILNIGKRNLSFILTPMVHWPDNMVTYCPEEKMLFSNDAFGQHLATSERFDDEYYIDIIMEEARKYYANIVLPYSLQVKKVLEHASELDFKMILPSHGIIFRKNIDKILKNYKFWSQNKTLKKALIIYDTMWHSTEKIAFAIQDAFSVTGYQTRILNLQFNHISDIMTEVLNAKYICVGSPTLNNNIMPNVSAFLTYLKGLSPKNRKGLAFGSYGWGGQSIGLVENELKSAGFDMLEQIKINYIPDEKQLKKIKNNLIQQIK